MTDPTMIERKRGWMSAWVGNELILMNGETGAYLSLSETGGKIWEILSEPKSVAVLCTYLGREYERHVDQVRPDILEFVEQMIEEQTIEVSPSTAGWPN